MREAALERMVVELERGGVLLLGWRNEALSAQPVVSLDANYIPPLASAWAGADRLEESLLGACAIAESLGLSLPLLGYWAHWAVASRAFSESAGFPVAGLPSSPGVDCQAEASRPPSERSAEHG